MDRYQSKHKQSLILSLIINLSNLVILFFSSRIWDKVAVGAYKILVHVAVVILMTFRRLLLGCESINDVLDAISHVIFIFSIFHLYYINNNNNNTLLLFQINEETSELIVNKAIELWQQSGSCPQIQSQ